MSALVYLVGAPGVGKSTVMAALTERCERSSRAKPFAHDLLLSPDGDLLGAELGRRRATFSGTDALSMAVSPLACRFVQDHQFPLILAEGDRLAHLKFLEAAAAYNEVSLVYLDADQATLDRRTAQRGSKQDRAWRSGRATKARRLYEAGADRFHTVHVDAREPVSTVLAVLFATVKALEPLR